MPAKEYYPVVRTGRLNVAVGPYLRPQVEVNVEQLLSKVNRRLYRHARSYDVKIDLDAGAASTYQVYALTDSWMNEKALQMGYNMYLENSADERARIKESNIARWQDFRTQTEHTADYGHANPVTFAEGPQPQPAGGVQLTAGEFLDTVVVDSAGVIKTFSWGPTAAAKYSLLEEYDKAGNAQTSPDSTTGDMPYDDLMADDDAAMAARLQTYGNSPPYDATGVNAGSPWTHVATLSSAAGGQKLSTGFFKAPCGFVLISAGLVGADIPLLTDLSWTAKAGDYKGVSAPSLLDV